MRLDRVDLWQVRLPLIRPFRTSSSARRSITHIVIRAQADGQYGWGECVAPIDPYYCPETTGTCWHILTEFLVPSILGRSWSAIEDIVALYANVKGNPFARAGLELACWDLLGRASDVSLSSMLGGTRDVVESGVSLGIETSVEALYEQIDRYLDEGYRRVKLKIAPGHDVDVVRAVRWRYPSLPLQVDANSAYTLDDIDTFCQLDEFELLLIEQPLAHDDIFDHATLQNALRTPICLDESLRSAAAVRHALDLGSCRVVNVKAGRVGGLLEARRIHDLCLAREIPAWCGGMHEFGIGRAANVALASLPGFTLPGDVSGSDKYYHEDLVEPSILAKRGAIDVPPGPGIGHEPVLERIEHYAIEHWSQCAR